ncbi:MAG: hypothetical protein CMF59_06925 [Leptospiraceae bacterium]|nr:hypothetical protein [Leptospiraceae bacterium]
MKYSLAALTLILTLSFCSTSDSEVKVQGHDAFRFVVDEVEMAKEPIRETPASTLLEEKLSHGTILAHSVTDSEDSMLVDGLLDLPMSDTRHMLEMSPGFQLNNLVQAVHFAHSQHRPLVLSPDIVWIAILQGFALHQRIHNSIPVKRKELDAILFHDFDPENPRSDWTPIIEKLSVLLLEAEDDESLKMLLPEFSTTTTRDRMVMRATLLTAYQDKYEYSVGAICGIPHITLLGTVDDWKKLRNRAELLRTYDLDWWLESLLPVLDQFVAARSQRIDRVFWQSIYKKKGEYVSQGLNGWILLFYPYIRQPARITTYDSMDSRETVQVPAQRYERNVFVTNPEAPCGDPGSSRTPCFLPLEQIPADTGSFPLTLRRRNTGQEYDLEFYSGIIGIRQGEDLSLTPLTGWYAKMRSMK